MIIRTLIITSLLLIFTPPCAHAEERLTPHSIQAFLDESSTITHPETGGDSSEIKEFLEKHISPRADFITNIVYDIEGYPPQMREMKMDKAGFIKNVTQSANKLQDYTSFSKLVQHDITGAGRKADIIVVTSETGYMDIKGAMIPFDGKTRCAQIISWKTPHGIVIESANCETILTIREDPY